MRTVSFLMLLLVAATVVVCVQSNEQQQCAAGETGPHCAPQATVTAPPPAKPPPTNLQAPPPAPPVEGEKGKEATAESEDLPKKEGTGDDDLDKLLEGDDDDGEDDEGGDDEEMDWTQLAKVVQDVIKEAKGPEGMKGIQELVGGDKETAESISAAADGVQSLIAAATPFAKAMLGKEKDKDAGAEIAKNLIKFGDALDDKIVKGATDLLAGVATEAIKARNAPPDVEEEPGVAFSLNHRRRGESGGKKKPDPRMPDPEQMNEHLKDLSKHVNADLIKYGLHGVAAKVDGMSSEKIHESVKTMIEMAPQMLQAMQAMAGAGGTGRL